MITWPDIFPDPTVTYSGQVKDSVKRTEMDAGNVRQRRRFTSTTRIQNAAWVLSDEQFLIFQAVVEHQLNGGADWFLINLALGDSGLQQYQARFAAPFKHEYQSVLYWRVTAPLEVNIGSPLSAEGLALLLSFGFSLDALFFSLDRFHTLIHTTLPGDLL